MPLDFDLIDYSLKYSLDKLENKKNTNCPYLFLLHDFLHPTLIDKLHNYCLISDKWIPQENYGKNSNHEHRLKINWDPDTVVEEVHVIFEHLTQHINKFLNKKTKFLGISLWKDASGHFQQKHIDNPTIDVSIQVYLNGGVSDLNTVFEYNNSIIKTTYVKNHGYLLNNEGKVPHYFNAEIPKNYFRFSLYGVWGKV